MQLHEWMQGTLTQTIIRNDMNEVKLYMLVNLVVLYFW
jgi:hypothetical protein